MKIISGLLLLVTVFLSFRHGWEGLNMAFKEGESNMLTEMGLGKYLIAIVSIVTLAVGVMVLFPQTFFIANLLNALTIVAIMALSLRSGNSKTAFIEIPFLLIPLVLIWLGHPLKK